MAEIAQEVQAAIDAAVGAALGKVSETLATRITEAVTQATSDLTAKVQTLGEQLADANQRIEKATAVDPESVSKTVTDLFQAELAKQTEARTAAETAAAAKRAVAEKRTEFLTKHALKLPASYHGMIPETDKAEELQAGLAAAVAKFQAEAKAAGITVPDVGVAAATAPNKPAIDPAKLSPQQKIEVGHSQKQ